MSTGNKKRFLYSGSKSRQDSGNEDSYHHPKKDCTKSSGPSNDALDFGSVWDIKSNVSIYAQNSLNQDGQQKPARNNYSRYSNFRDNNFASRSRSNSQIGGPSGRQEGNRVTSKSFSYSTANNESSKIDLETESKYRQQPSMFRNSGLVANSRGVMNNSKGVQPNRHHKYL
ncbi:uncharacterized protein LOC141913703 [Tubulanus polymorphus]|uniref:uncharacterized protein LOC141913703 n=1 Tax=Tubulanus polymorphus TaxID=672921 RepID=UPI003DA5E92C